MTSFYPVRKIATFPSGASIYVGSEATAQNGRFLSTNRIGLIVNCTKDVPFYYPDLYRGIRLPVDDSPADVREFARHVKSVCATIDRFVRAGSSILIHCYAGISRSASCCAAFLVLYCGMSASQAVSFVRSKKPETFSNGEVFGSALRNLRNIRKRR